MTRRAKAESEPESASKPASYFVCREHRKTSRQDTPGKCPTCGEPLVPVLSRQVANTMAFRDLIISRLNPPEQGQVVYWDEACIGLSLMVGPRTKTFRVQFKLNGKYITAQIGRFGEMDGGDATDGEVTKARAIARQWRSLAKEGTNPRQQEQARQKQAAQAQAKKPTYEEVVDEFITHYAKPRQRTWDQTERVLKNNCKEWLNRPFAEITRKQARDLLREFTKTGHVYKASVTKAWLKKLWRWAVGEELVDVPVMDGVPLNIEKRERDRVYSGDEIKATWNAADRIDPVAGAYVKLLILLAPRKTALAAMRWSHLDDADNPTIWTTPFELTKSRKSSTKKREYLTPLPPLAQRILKGLPKGDARVFPSLPVHETAGGRPTFHGVELQRRLVEHGAPADFAFHAWRHTVATWLKKANVGEWERALVLNHSESGVTAGYSHGYPLELKRKVLTQWSDHVERLVQPEGAVLLR